MSEDDRNAGDRGKQSPEERCPEDVLGWMLGYVDGILSDEARRRVEAHVAVCAECRRELDLVAGVPVDLEVELPDPGRIFDEILGRIEALPAESGTLAAPVRSRDLFGRETRSSVEDWSEEDRVRLRDWLLAGDASQESQALDEPEHRAGAAAGRRDVGLRSVGRRGSRGLGGAWQLAAAILLVMLGGAGGAILSAALLPQSSGDGAEVIYRPATATGDAAGFREGALDVVFREGSTELEIRQALRDLGAEIVAGPTAMGVYRVRVRGPVGTGAGQDRLRAVAEGLVGSGAGVAVFAEFVP